MLKLKEPPQSLVDSPDLPCTFDLRMEILALINAYALLRDGYTHVSVTLESALATTRGGRPELPSGVDFEDLVDETEAFPESKLTFKEQCYLLTNIFNLAKIKEEIDHGLNPSVYTGIPMKKLSSVASKENRTVLAVGEPFGFINRLTQSPSKSEFFEITNAQLSTLIPMVRLFKVIENTEELEQCNEITLKNLIV